MILCARANIVQVTGQLQFITSLSLESVETF